MIKYVESWQWVSAIETNGLDCWPGLGIDHWLLTFLLVSCDGLASAEPIPPVKHPSSGSQRKQCANKQLGVLARSYSRPLGS